MREVLVVDDSRVARSIARRFLEGAGHRVREAASIDEGWAVLLGGSQVDLVLLDWNMPGGNGLELLNRMRAEASTAHVPVVFATSEVDVVHVAYAQEAGANAYITKPFTEARLLEAVDRALLS